MEQQLLSWISHYGVFALYGLLALGIVGLPIPDETLLTLAGALVRKGELSLIPTLVAAYSGTVSGVTISYFIGRFASTTFLHKHFHTGMVRLEKWFERIGRWALAFGYFIPGIRHFTAIGAGSSELPYSLFARYAYGGAALWTASFLALGYFLGAHVPDSFHAIRYKTLLACLIGALCVAGYELYRRHMAEDKS